MQQQNKKQCFSKKTNKEILFSEQLVYSFLLFLLYLLNQMIEAEPSLVNSFSLVT